MKRTFLALQFLSLSIYKFDTQDNLVKCLTSDWGQYEQNVNLDTFEPINEIGLWRNGNKTFWVKTKFPAKTIRINNYPHRYKVKKVTDTYFIVRSVDLQKYFDTTDVIEIIVKK